MRITFFALLISIPASAQGVAAGNEKATATLNRFLLDATQPARVKTVVVCALSQVAANHAASRAAISSFLDGDLDPRTRTDATNAVACLPSDDLATARTVAKNLTSKEADVRAAAIQVIGRLGPKAVAINQDTLLQIANRLDERPDIRKLAERVALKRWD